MGDVWKQVPVMATGECAGVTVAKRTKGKKRKSGHNKEREGKRKKGGGGGGEKKERQIKTRSQKVAAMNNSQNTKIDLEQVERK